MDLSEAREVFMQECGELLDRMESLLIEESTNPRGERETIDSLFRVVHTIKGSAGIFGFDRIERFAHDLESLMDRVRGGEKELNQGLVELLLRSRDHLSNLMQLLNVREESAAAVMGANLDASQTSLLSEVRAMIDGGAVVPAAKPQAAAPSALKENTYRIVLMFKPELFSHGLDPLPVVRNLRTCGEVLQFHLILDRLPALAAVSPETCYLGCEMILRSSLSEKELRSELEFVQDDCEISISEESAPTSPAVTGEAAKAAPAPASAFAEPVSSSSDPSYSKPSPAPR
jgi:two-component system chemotaxis sensor kinase CheA